MIAKKESPRSIRKTLLYGTGAIFCGVAAFVAAYGTLPALMSVSYTEPTPSVATSTPAQVKPAALAIVHLPTPSSLKAIYMSQCVAGTPSFRNSLVKFIEDSALNAVVIDIRDYSGKISFRTDNPVLKDSVSSACGATDMPQFIQTLHDKGIYVIGRITTFQNPYWTSVHPEQAVQKVGGGVWKDFKGLSFVDVGATPYWNNVVELSKVSYALGFDELNFDYIRFPSDGPMAEADYTYDVGKSKAQALEEFYQYLHDQLAPTGVVISADLFGYVTVHTDDLGIGQILERAMPYFDYIDPMVYPSHYNSGFNGIKDVNSDPYGIVFLSLKTAVARATAATTTVEALAETPIIKTVIIPATASAATTTKEVPTGMYQKAIYPASKIRPWLQSFDYPVVYTPEMVAAQIKATTDVGLDSYLVWDAANKYNALRIVLAATSTTQ
jgi:hypothetical protein